MLSLPPANHFRDSYLPHVRNHLRAAQSHLRIRDGAVGEFSFERAIQAQDQEAVEARARSGMILGTSSWPTFCLEALDVNGLCRGQVFVVCNGATAILMHSWFDRSGPRGIPTLLVDQAVDRARADWGIQAFDFEGSVIPSIDRFMAGFGARPVAYPQLRWGTSSEKSAVSKELG